MGSGQLVSRGSGFIRRQKVVDLACCPVKNGNVKTMFKTRFCPMTANPIKPISYFFSAIADFLNNFEEFFENPC